MERYIQFADQLSTWFGHAFALVIMLMTFGVSYEVFVRYVLRAPDPLGVRRHLHHVRHALHDGGRLHAVADGHVRADFIYRLLDAAHAGVVELVLYFLFFFPGHPRADLRRMEVCAPLVALPRGQHL